jgi:hypothetical protein
VELSVDKQSLKFKLTDSCPVNEDIKDSFKMVNASNSKVNYFIYPLIAATSHRISVLPKDKGELKKVCNYSDCAYSYRVKL